MDDLTGELDYPMAIVTAASNGERSGCLVGFHTQCSIDPMRWAVWISKANHTHHVAHDAGALAVHFPSIDDEDLAELFGSETADEIDKFERCDWTEGPGGLPLLDRLGNRITGAVVSRIDDGGDHECFVIAVDDMQHDARLRQLGFQDVRDLEPGHPA
jgi:flavin reductase (DIM6/NTAB) family NADH-FMN oxidoreductase RutF